MPSVETFGQLQKAVLWEANGYDGDGNATVSAPVEIDVRWEETQEQATDANGGPITIVANVHVNQIVPVGSIVWQGELTDVSSPATNLKEVITCEKIPDVKCRNTKYTLSLAKFSDSLPTIV